MWNKLILAMLSVLVFANPIGFKPVGSTWGTLPKYLQVLAAKTPLPDDFFTDCRPVDGKSCVERFKGVVLGQPLLYSEKLFLHYIFGNGEMISELPPHLEEEVRKICSSPEAVRDRKKNRIQVSSYGNSHSEEIEYSLGSFGCIEEENYYRIIDRWKVDPPVHEDDLMEGGYAAHKLTTYFCKVKGCKAFPIFIRIPK